MSEPAISFGAFRLVPARRLLLEGDKPVRLGGRAFDILTALVERAGEVVTKEALMARVWPQTFVEEANLKIQVSALRRVLGDGQGAHRYIVTVPGRGYDFVAPVRLGAPSPPSRTREIVSAQGNNLPLAVIRVIGRDQVVRTVAARLSRQRLVTIAGPGGIGKTTVALAVAEHMIADFEHGVWLVDLAPLADPRFVPSAVATALGLELHAEDPLPGLVTALRGRRLLLLLDNCEHVIDAAAAVVAAVLGGAPDVSILATSREPLGVQGERVYRLEPLSTPEPSPGLTAAEAAAFPAVQLFVERVTEIVEDFALTDANAALIVEICRRLDGLPLAIEFAAPRVEVLGIEGLASGLDDSLRMLGTPRRATMPRHRTMQAVIEWSYGLLSEDEQQFLRALGIFAGGFTSEAAEAVTADAAAVDLDAIDRLADLVAKSLVVVDVSGIKPRFRLLGTTRSYALKKLQECGERDRLAQRHAAYFRSLFAPPVSAFGSRVSTEGLIRQSREIDNVRMALDWCFSSSGEATIGIELTASYAPVWIDLALMIECCQRCERALLGAEHAEASSWSKMWLRIALGSSLIRAMGSSERAYTVLTEAIAIADALGDLDAQARTLSVLAAVHVQRGEYGQAEVITQRLRQIAGRIGDPALAIVADRAIANSLINSGKIAEGRQCLERVLRSPAVPDDRRRSNWQHSEHRAMARALLARALWLQGFADQARAEAQAGVEELHEARRELSLCRVLYYGMCRIAPMTGDFGAADQAIGRLVEVATRLNLPFWKTAGRLLQGKLLVARREFAQGVSLLRDGFETWRLTGWQLSYPEFKGAYAEALAGLGQTGDALAAVDGAIASAGERGAGQWWYVPELRRIKANVLIQEGSDRYISAAEECFDQAATLAREQGALTWELRIGLSLCRLRETQGRGDEGRRELASLYDRFTESFGTADLIAAKQLLDALGYAGGD